MSGLSSWTQVPNHSVLLDVTVLSIAANQELQSPKTGFVGTAQNPNIGITPNSIQSTTVPNKYVWDATEIEIIPPVDANGNFPDCQVTFYNGTSKLDELFVIDGSVQGNMFPRAALTIAGKKLVLGERLRELLLANKANPGSVSNMAARATGLKVNDSLTIAVKSLAGWGQAGAAVVPLRVIVRGDYMREDDIIPLSGYWNGQVSLNVPPAAPFVAMHQPKFPFNQANWGTLPGGTNQGSVKINKRINYAYNAEATSIGNDYIFSQKDTLLGSINNVVDQQHDLGDDNTGNNNAFLWQEFGVRTTGPVYFGFRVDNTKVPQDNTLGTYITPHVNDWQYGSEQPQLPGSGRFYALHDAKKFVRVLAYGLGVVPYVNTGGMNVLAANSISIAKSGILIQQP